LRGNELPLYFLKAFFARKTRESSNRRLHNDNYKWCGDFASAPPPPEHSTRALMDRVTISTYNLRGQLGHRHALLNHNPAILVCLALGMQWQSLSAIAVPALLAVHGSYTNKLTFGGACMSAAVGWLLLAAGLKYFISVMAFYAIGTTATKFRSVAKVGMVHEGTGLLKSYGQRGAQQVAIKGNAFDFDCIDVEL
jgi:hypothetical protein